MNLIEHLHSHLPRELVLDLQDAMSAKALQAYEMVRDHAELDGKRARALTGQARFRMQEKAFQEVCSTFGGEPLENDVIPGTDLHVFQPFMRFGGEKSGVIFGMAAMPERATLPHKNMSRRAGVRLNYQLSPRFDFDGSGPKVGDVFALLLISRDPTNIGRIDEIAVGIIDAEYETFVEYEAIEKFVVGYSTYTADMITDKHSSRPKLVKLKQTRVPYQPPEDSTTAETQQPREEDK